ncbi:unnamed protein product [Meloidogyne enterolobii]|uniref:Uncharacterized protein n=1 Tax=Meloidogyne enterolobii TaxID=390850 RepID=A0ACB0ZFF2_MELEN
MYFICIDICNDYVLKFMYRLYVLKFSIDCIFILVCVFISIVLCIKIHVFVCVFICIELCIEIF